MKFSLYLILFCFGSWGALTIVFPSYTNEIFWAMIAPLIEGIISILIVEKTFKSNPQRLTQIMGKAFITKLIFYGLYITFILLFYTFNPIPFIVSFASFFILLRAFEALYFRTIFKAQ